MSTRKIKITPKNRFDIPAIMEDLGCHEIILEVPDTKETMGYLCSSPLIEDWDFIQKPISDEKKTETQFEEKDFDELAYFLEDTYEIYKESPAIKFNSKLFQVSREKLNKSTLLVDHALIKMILESRYTGWEWEDVCKDFTESLHKVWVSKKIDNCNTLAEFVKLVYEDLRK